MKLFYFGFLKNKMVSSYFVLTLLVCCLANNSLAQIIPTAGETECFVAGNGGVFLDTGGSTIVDDNDLPGEYINCNCSTVTTLCSPDGSAITVQFDSFSVFATFDYLSIYDGDTNMGTLLYDNSTGGINANDQTLAEMIASNGSATFEGTTGCLTFDFFATGVVSDPGWYTTVTVASGATHPGDNLECGTNLSCLAPPNINAINITNNSADLTWMASDSASSYNIEYGLAGFTLGNGTFSNITDTFLNLTGLIQNTQYEFYVQSDCDASGMSNFAGPFSFMTTFANPCDYTLNLFDSFGDGWNGAALTVTVGCISTEYTFASGDFATFTVNAGSNLPLIFTYASGTFENEVTYEILDPMGNIIYSDGPFPNTGVVLETFACPTCPGPTNFNEDLITGNGVNLSWNAADSAGVYQIEYGPTGFTPGTGTILTTTDPFISINGLDENTTYDYYGLITCDNGGESGLACANTFTTRKLNDVGIVAINSPNAGCGLGSSEIISVTMQNFGSNPQSLVPFKYSVNGVEAAINIPLDGYFTNVIGFDSTIILEFETTADFSGAGTFEIVAWTELDNDSDHSNDTTVFSFETYRLLPLKEDFNGSTILPDGWTTDGTIGDGHNNISNVIFRNLYGSVPNFEVTTPDLGLVEAGDMLSFDYRYTDWSPGTVGTDLGAGDMLEVQASTDCGATFNTIFTIDQNNHVTSADLATIDIDLSNFIGQSVRFRWFATRANGDYWLDIDNINIGSCRPLMFTPSITDESLLGASDGTITLNHDNGTGPYTYNWNNGEMTQTISNLSAGTYTVDVIDNYGCVGQIEVTVGLFVNTNELENTIQSIKLYPNPTNEVATLDMIFSKSVDVQIQIINTIGQVLNEVFIEKTSEQKVELDLSDFPDGMYFVRIKADNQMTVKKLMKSHP